MPEFTETQLLDKYDECWELARDEETDEPQNQKAEDLFTRWRSLNDLYFFATQIQQMDKGVDKDTGRRRIDPYFHQWLCNELEAQESSIILVPRDHLKTSFVKLRIMQEVLRDPNRVRTALFSKNGELVSKSLTDIKRRFLKPVMRELFPDEIPDPGRNFRQWATSNANQMTMRRFQEEGDPPQENQIEAWGQGKEITGNHYKLIVLDDIIDQKNCTTAEQIVKVEEWVAYLDHILDPFGKFIVIGTRYHYDDVYARILEGAFPRHAVRRATEPGFYTEKDAKPIYKYYTKEMLDAKRKRLHAFTGSDYQFYCQWYNEPIPRDDQMFPPPQTTYQTLPADYAPGGGQATYWISIDPAHTVEDYSDRTAVCVACVASNGVIYIVESHSYKKSHDIIARHLCELIDTYKPDRVGIESGFHEDFQYIFKAIARDYERQQKTTLNVTEFLPMKVGNQFSKAERVNRTLGAFCRNHRVFIHESLTPLMRQMEHFPKTKRDDEVDAAAMIIPLSQAVNPGIYGYDLPDDGDMWYWTVQGRIDRRGKKDKTWAGAFKHAG